MTAKSDIPKEESGFAPHEIVWTDEKVSRLWNYYSGHDTYQQEYFSYQAGRIVRNLIQRYVGLQQLAAILDYGCGPGFLIEALLERLNPEQKVCGLDFSQASAALVDEKFSHHPSYGGTFWAQSLPSDYKDNSMDMVIALEVIEHLEEDKLISTFEELRRILKPRGHVVITTPNSENLMKEKVICPDCGAIFHRWQHIRTWSAATLTRFMAENGFRKMHVMETNFAIKHQLLAKYFLRLFPRKRDRLFFIGAKVGPFEG